MTRAPESVALPATIHEIKKQLPKFKVWLDERGSEVLPSTNPYELIRFSTMAGVAIIHGNSRGIVSSWSNGAEEAYRAFVVAGSWRGERRRKRTTSDYRTQAVLQRDGDICFFCGTPLGDDKTPEHLLSITHGGRNHIANMALAHEACNRRAGHLCVVEKVKLRETMHRENGRCL